MKIEGFNIEGIFDAEIPAANNIRRKETEDEQVLTLIDRKGYFSAFIIHIYVETICITSDMVLKAQR